MMTNEDKARLATEAALATSSILNDLKEMGPDAFLPTIIGMATAVQVYREELRSGPKGDEELATIFDEVAGFSLEIVKKAIEIANAKSDHGDDEKRGQMRN